MIRDWKKPQKFKAQKFISTNFYYSEYFSNIYDAYYSDFVSLIFIFEVCRMKGMKVWPDETNPLYGLLCVVLGAL